MFLPSVKIHSLRQNASVSSYSLQKFTSRRYVFFMNMFFLVSWWNFPLKQLELPSMYWKLPWNQRKLLYFRRSFHWLSLTLIDPRLVPQSLHMLARAAMSFRPYRRGGGKAAHSLVQLVTHTGRNGISQIRIPVVCHRPSFQKPVRFLPFSLTRVRYSINTTVRTHRRRAPL